MCENQANPLTPEAGIFCAQVGIEKKDFILTLDVNRDELGTDAIDEIMNELGFVRNYEDFKLPESTYYGNISEDTDVEELFNKIMMKIDELVKDKSIKISLCGGFINSMCLKKRGDK